MNRTLAWINPHDPLPPTSAALTPEEGANGLLAAGSDLTATRLLEAYGRGIFPWFSHGEPVLWWTPSPRMVLMLDEFKISHSFRQTIRKALNNPILDIQVDQDFRATIQACATPRSHQAGTWINDTMIDAYAELHAMGHAHSIEVLRDDERIGGLYCVVLGRMVYGESMFSRHSNGSKLALAALVGWLRSHGAQMIDCQQRTNHLLSLGGREIDRPLFESLVNTLTQRPALPWRSQPPSKTDLGRL